jgi:hypothetical protein
MRGSFLLGSALRLVPPYDKIRVSQFEFNISQAKKFTLHPIKPKKKITHSIQELKFIISSQAINKAQLDDGRLQCFL